VLITTIFFFLPAAGFRHSSDISGASSCPSVRPFVRVKEIHTEILIKVYNKLIIYERY
jgi:hypothetical protein